MQRGVDIFDAASASKVRGGLVFMLQTLHTCEALIHVAPRQELHVLP